MSNYTSVNLAVADPRFYTGGTNPYVAKSPTNPMKLKKFWSVDLGRFRVTFQVIFL